MTGSGAATSAARGARRHVGAQDRHCSRYQRRVGVRHQFSCHALNSLVPAAQKWAHIRPVTAAAQNTWFCVRIRRMDTSADWHDLGAVDELSLRPLQELKVAGKRIALSFRDGQFGAISGVCNHVGGPLGQGRLDGEYVVCPWHNWKYHCRDGAASPATKPRASRATCSRSNRGALVDLNSAPAPPPAAPAASAGAAGAWNRRAAARARDLDDLHEQVQPALLDLRGPADRGIAPRGDHGSRDAIAAPCAAEVSSVRGLLLQVARMPARGPARSRRWIRPTSSTGSTRRSCTGPTWSWSRRRSAGARRARLYYKMVERMNCVQNQITIANRVLLRNKVVRLSSSPADRTTYRRSPARCWGSLPRSAAMFPQFPYIAHCRGWSAEDMEKNVSFVQQSEELREGAHQLAVRAMAMAATLKGSGRTQNLVPRGGRKADGLGIGMADAQLALAGAASPAQNRQRCRHESDFRTQDPPSCRRRNCNPCALTWRRRCASRFEMDWHEAVGNHFSLAVSADGKQFLMNPRWKHFSLIRASDLLLLDSGDMQTMSRPDAPDASAWCIHGRIHARRAACPLRAARASALRYRAGGPRRSAPQAD